MTNDLRIRFTRVQSRVLRTAARFKVCICGRRGGKTFLDNAWLLQGAAEHPKSFNVFVGPTLDDSRDLFYEPLLDRLPAELVAHSNRTRLEIALVNGSVLRGFSADKAKRGRGIDRLVCDEFAWWDNFTEIWQGELRPSLSDTGGAALFTTTPAGYNHAYDLYMQGGDEWAAFQWTTLEGGQVPESEIEAARRDLDPRIFRQEYEASFETLEGRVYLQFDRDENVADVKDAGAEILVGMDFNVNPMSAVLGCRVAGQCHIFDEVEIQTSNTDEMANEIRHRYPDRKVIVCPDPTGKARKTSAGGRTDFSILQNAGFETRSPGKPPLVRDRVNNTNANLLSADGTRRLFVHPRCRSLIKALDGLTYKKDTNQPDKASGLDHITDALGYLLWQEFNLLAPRDWGVQTLRL